MALALNPRLVAPLRSEAALVDATRDGDDRAFEQLYARYRERIHAFILSKVRDHGRAEDLGQEVFMSALRQLRATKAPIVFKPWLYTIAKNACIDEFRRGARGREIPIESDEQLANGASGERLVSAVPTPVSAIEAKQSLADLRGAFGGLTESQHRLLVMRELEGLSYEEIGTRLGMSKQMVESGLFRARRKLSEEYEELASGRRCEQIQTAIDTGRMRTVRGLGIKDRRRYARHLSHCQPCRHHAMAAGVDSALLKPRSLVDKVAALLPFGLLTRLVRRPIGRGVPGAGHGAGAAAGGAGAAGTAGAAFGGLGPAAAVAALALAGAGGGLAIADHGHHHAAAPVHHAAGPARHATSSSATGAGSAASRPVSGGRGSRDGGAGSPRPVNRHATTGAIANPMHATHPALHPASGGAGPTTAGGPGSTHSGTAGSDPVSAGAGTVHTATRTAGRATAATTTAAGGTATRAAKTVGATVTQAAKAAGGTVTQATKAAATTVTQATKAAGGTVTKTTTTVATTAQKTTTAVATTVQKTVPGAGSGVGSIVTHAGSTAGSAVNQAGSTAGSTVTNAGSAIGKALTGTGSAVGTAVSGLGG